MEEATHAQMMLATFADAMALGVLFIVIAHRIRVSAIVVLLLGGIAVGPQGFGRWLGFTLVDPSVLGDGLQTIVSLAVGLILFEGGLTLDPKGFKQASIEIRGVLTKGVLITWLCSALAIYLVFGFPWDMCFLSAGLIIVTGPTVIGPLLKRIRVGKRIHNILHWEGVLIDPVGVFVALFCYEWIITGGVHAIGNFLLRLAVGGIVGIVWGGVMAWILHRGWIDSERSNIVVLASAVANFAVADHLAHESGLLSITISGMVIGLLDAPDVQRLKTYKAELIELLIGLLFVLLAANLDLNGFLEYGWKLVAIVAIVMFLIRPLNIFLSTWGTPLNFREKLFLSWVAPRGIVAASMASLFFLNLSQKDGLIAEHASFLQPFTYSVIAGTVIIQGFTAGFVGKALGVLEPKPTGWLIIGAHQVARRVAAFIQRQGFSVVLLDTNVRSTALARREGLVALQVNAVTANPDQHPQLYGTGNVLAITENVDLNTLVCQRWKKELPYARHFKWGSSGGDTGRARDQEMEAGEVIWRVVQEDNLKAMTREDGDNYMYVDTTTVGRLHHPERVLMCLHGKSLTPGVPPELEPDAEVTVLMYRPFAVRLNLKLEPNWVSLSHTSSMAELFHEMLDTLSHDFPRLNVADLHSQLLTQEQEYSSLIGYGVALPHAYSDQLKQSVVMAARLEKPVADSHSSDHIHAVFLVLSPRDDARNHLNALSEISRFIMDEHNRELLLNAGDRQDLLQLLFPDVDADTRTEAAANAEASAAAKDPAKPDNSPTTEPPAPTEQPPG